jgi:hypothetical protein
MFIQPLAIKHPGVNNLKTNNVRAFFEDVHRCGGHRPREDTPDIGVVTAGGGEEDYLAGGGGGEDGGYYCYVREVARVVCKILVKSREEELTSRLRGESWS